MSFEKERKTKKPLSIRLKQSTKAALDRACHNEDRTISDIVDRALRKELKCDNPE